MSTFSNCFGMPHWGCKYFCWECFASKDEACGCLRWPGKTSEGRPREQPLGHHPVFDIPGVTRHNIGQDALHILYTKGCLAHGVGSFCMNYAGMDVVGRASSQSTDVRWFSRGSRNCTTFMERPLRKGSTTCGSQCSPTTRSRTRTIRFSKPKG